MIQPNYVFKATVTRVIDGDTIVASVSPAFKITLVDYKFRLFGIDTAELNDTDPVQRERAQRAKSHVMEKIWGHEVLMQTVKNTLGAEKIDSFGRYLAIVYYVNDRGEQVNLNEELLALGLAVPMKG